jgi:hypothetical protein
MDGQDTQDKALFMGRCAESPQNVAILLQKRSGLAGKLCRWQNKRVSLAKSARLLLEERDEQAARKMDTGFCCIHFIHSDYW